MYIINLCVIDEPKTRRQKKLAKIDLRVFLKKIDLCIRNSIKNYIIIRISFYLLYNIIYIIRERIAIVFKCRRYYLCILLNFMYICVLVLYLLRKL